MDNVYTTQEQRLLVSSLRLLFDALARSPIGDPVKRQSREYLSRILSILEGRDRKPASP